MHDKSGNEDLQVVPSRLGGLGVIARRAFQKGEVVFLERPFLTVSLSRHQKWRDQQGTISGDSEASQKIKRQVALLSEADRAEFWKFGQAPVYGEKPSEHGIFWTNCIDVVEIGTAMFLRTCRLNHSCEASVTLDWQNGWLSSVATRDIAPGEELLLSYMSPTMDGHGEALSLPQYLQEWYGFVCQCGVCQSALPLAAQGVWAEVLQGGIGAYAAGAGPFQGPGAAAGGTGRGWGHSQAGGGSGAGPVLSMDPDDMPFL